MLQRTRDLAQRDLIEKLGISLRGLNYSLKALMEKGLVKIRNFAPSKDKFGDVYMLTPTGMTEKAVITDRFLQREMDDYEALQAEIDALTPEPGHDQADGLRRQAK